MVVHAPNFRTRLDREAAFMHSAPRRHVVDRADPLLWAATPTGGGANTQSLRNLRETYAQTEIMNGAHSPRSAAAGSAAAAGRGARSLLELGIPITSDASEVCGVLQHPRLQDVARMLDL